MVNKGLVVECDERKADTRAQTGDVAALCSNAAVEKKKHKKQCEVWRKISDRKGTWRTGELLCRVMTLKEVKDRHLPTPSL